MNWEQKAVAKCSEKGLEVLEIDSGYVFVKDNEGKIYPISEYIVAEWINNEQ